jgi:hypothetical protein
MLLCSIAFGGSKSALCGMGLRGPDLLWVGTIPYSTARLLERVAIFPIQDSPET